MSKLLLSAEVPQSVWRPPSTQDSPQCLLGLVIHVRIGDCPDISWGGDLSSRWCLFFWDTLLSFILFSSLSSPAYSVHLETQTSLLGDSSLHGSVSSYSTVDRWTLGFHSLCKLWHWQDKLMVRDTNRLSVSLSQTFFLLRGEEGEERGECGYV